MKASFLRRGNRPSVRLGALTIFAVALIAALVGGVQSASSAGGGSTSYIVQLAEPPAAAYTGDLAGYPATAPAKGKKLNSADPDVAKYVEHLKAVHADIAGKVGASKFYDYSYSFDGFAADLTAAQVAELSKLAEVVSVDKDVLQNLETDNTPSFLGLSAPGGLWSQLGGQDHAGENVIVGMVDTGIWPEHPSFSDQNDLAFRPGESGKNSYAYSAPPASWHGSCQSGERWSQDLCGRKLIGARYFLSGFGHFGVIKNDFKSARDADGHGSHTSSTAAGNGHVPASILGSNLGEVSGMAPRARIATYKVCWNGASGGCASTDSVAAIDQAVADGVDVINFSISGTSTNYFDPVEVAFLFASRAGVFVAASAGNSGPGVSTVAHVSPWLTTVAASTQNRSFKGQVILGSGATFSGVTITGGAAQTGLVDAANAGGQFCAPGTLSSAVSGKIVICKRGGTAPDGHALARVEKSLAVKQAGGTGMVLYNRSNTQSLNTDNHYVPTVHVNFTDGLAIKAYAATPGATASLIGGTRVIEGGNTMADFSSRGPSLGGAGDLIKPDVTAPGVNILAGNSPEAFLGAPGQLFQSISGTSMSSPHVAGLGALLTQAHPGWSPAAMKSALMTTARQDLKKEDGVTAADPFDFGAGHVAPNPANDPGLVYDASFDDYRGFLRSQRLCTKCFGTAPAPVMKPTDLNVASIGVGKLAGSIAVTRKLTNVGPSGTYNVSVNAPSGIDAVVNPTSLTFATGETKSYTVTFTSNSSAAFDAYSFGSLTWTDGSHSVRIPIAIKPVKLAFPAEQTPAGTGVSGSTSWSVRFGYTGPFSVGVQGLVPAATDTRTVADDPTNHFNVDDPDSNQGIQRHDFTIPAGTAMARFQTFGSSNAGDDIDMYVYRVVGTTKTLVGSSAGGTAAEVVTLKNPAGTYQVYMHGWQPVTPTTQYTLFSWLVPSSAAGNMTATSSAASATTAGTSTITATWSGLTAGSKYMGRVTYSDGGGEIGGTIVRVDG